LTALVLDAKALSLLARSGSHERTVRAALVAAVAESADVVVPVAVLAELYRGGGYDQAVDACRPSGVDADGLAHPVRHANAPGPIQRSFVGRESELGVLADQVDCRPATVPDDGCSLPVGTDVTGPGGHSSLLPQLRRPVEALDAVI
jgi:hypothetical protein